MALTAARTELNVSLVGEDETIRMLEDAKKRMADLEAKTRSLTGATKAQTEAAKAQEAVTVGVNDRLKGLAERAEGVVGGVDKVKGAFEKVVGVAGFLGMAVSGAIDAFNFLRNAFDDSEGKAAELEKQMARNKAESDRLRGATDALTASLHRMKAATGQSAAVLAAERATLADLRGDTVTANFERQVVATEQQKATLNDLRTEEKARDEERKSAVKEAIDSQERQRAIQGKIDEAERKERAARNEASRAWDKSEARDKAARAAAEAGAQKVLLAIEKSRETLALKTRDSIDEANVGLRERIEINKQILEQQLINAGLPIEATPAARGGGGGGRPVADELAQRQEDWEKFLGQFEREVRDRSAYAQHLRQMQADNLDRQKKLMGEPQLFAEAERMRKRIADELAALPGDATAKAFDPLRTELQKSAKALDEFLASRVDVGDRVAITLQEEDAIVAAYEKQAEALDKLKSSTAELGETRAKAVEESAKLAEQLQRENLAGYVNSFSESLQGLADIEAPVFEVVTQSLSGITAQMEKFKSGQQTLTQAVVGSGAAIAAAVGDKVKSVKVEAGIRALFETAMGFANLGNPAVAVGHFTAAAMFGAVAGGLIPAQPKEMPGEGQKAPAKEAAQTRDSTMGGGGGQITNVYNLNTGIVDGQSTAHAFRRAEMTARNTGMASAGGW